MLLTADASKIAAIEQEIQVADKHSSTLKRTRNEMAAPLLSLTEDIIVMIYYILQDHIFDGDFQLKHWMYQLSICHYLRNIICKTPGLWLTVLLGKHGKFNLTQIEQWEKLCHEWRGEGDVKLHVKRHAPQENTMEPEIVKFAKRASHLRWTEGGHGQTTEALYDSILCKPDVWNCLRHLTVTIETSRSSWNIVPVKPLLLGGMSGTLQSLTLNLNEKWELDAFPYFPALEHLHIHELDIGKRSHKLREFLTDSINLRTLELLLVRSALGSKLDRKSKPMKPSLPCLHYVRLKGNAQPVECILDMLPDHLETLKVHFNADDASAIGQTSNIIRRGLKHLKSTQHKIKSGYHIYLTSVEPGSRAKLLLKPVPPPHRRSCVRNPADSGLYLAAIHWTHDEILRQVAPLAETLTLTSHWRLKETFQALESCKAAINEIYFSRGFPVQEETPILVHDYLIKRRNRGAVLECITVDIDTSREVDDQEQKLYNELAEMMHEWLGEEGLVKKIGGSILAQPI